MTARPSADVVIRCLGPPAGGGGAGRLMSGSPVPPSTSSPSRWSYHARRRRPQGRTLRLRQALPYPRRRVLHRLRWRLLPTCVVATPDYSVRWLPSGPTAHGRHARAGRGGGRGRAQLLPRDHPPAAGHHRGRRRHQLRVGALCLGVVYAQTTPSQIPCGPADGPGGPDQWRRHPQPGLHRIDNSTVTTISDDVHAPPRPARGAPRPWSTAVSDGDTHTATITPELVSTPTSRGCAQRPHRPGACHHRRRRQADGHR